LESLCDKIASLYRSLLMGMASPQTSVSPPTVTDDLLRDERWQLVQRIVSSTPFQKGTRLRDLLQYLAEQTIHGHAHELTEQHIGNALFHKPLDYSPLEDSSVRVHARQLRLKLHEYFDEEGRNEPLILSIPKGSYTPIFKPATKASTPIADAALRVSPAMSWRSGAILAWTLCGILLVVCAFLLYRSARHGTPGFTESVINPPWPFSQVFDSRHQTLIVVADSNYGMFRILTSQPGSLDLYLHRDFLQPPSKLRPQGADSRLNEYMTNSTLTSFADVADVAILLEMAGPLQKQATVRYPRDLAMRDLDHDNYVLIGSPGSNPWVSLFQNKLNFRESEAIVGNSAKAFVNTSPLPGEKDRYEGLRWTGAMGEDYATIALLPNVTHDGSVLVMQGLQQEGTEAAGRFLADPENRRQLKAKLGITGSRENSFENIWFEALIRSRTVAGAPNSTTLVAARRIE
jgi:hypothetical protein